MSATEEALARRIATNEAVEDLIAKALEEIEPRVRSEAKRMAMGYITAALTNYNTPAWMTADAWLRGVIERVLVDNEDELRGIVREAVKEQLRVAARERARSLVLERVAWATDEALGGGDKINIRIRKAAKRIAKQLLREED